MFVFSVFVLFRQRKLFKAGREVEDVHHWLGSGGCREFAKWAARVTPSCTLSSKSSPLSLPPLNAGQGGNQCSTSPPIHLYRIKPWRLCKSLRLLPPTFLDSTLCRPHGGYEARRVLDELPNCCVVEPLKCLDVSDSVSLWYNSDVRDPSRCHGLAWGGFLFYFSLFKNHC